MAKGVVFTREAADAILAIVRREMRRPTSRNTRQQAKPHRVTPNARFGYLEESAAGLTDPETAAINVDVQMLEINSSSADPHTLQNATTGGPNDDGILPCVYRFDSDLAAGTLVKIEMMYGQWHITSAGCNPLAAAVTST